MIHLDEWLEFRELNKGQSASTVANYRAVLVKFGEWLTRERIAETAVTPEILQRYAGAELPRRGLSPHSLRAAVSELLGSYAHLPPGGVSPRHPAGPLPYPPIRPN